MRTIVIIFTSVLLAGASIITLAQVPETNTDLKTHTYKSEVKSCQNTAAPTTDSESQKVQQKHEKNQIYIDNNWSTGTIELRSNDMINTCFLRYNILADQIEYIAGKDTLAFANPLNLNKVTFGEHTFIYVNYQCEDSICEGYFEVIVPGKNKLMLKRSVTNQKPDVKNPDDQSSMKYKIGECYFISKPGIPANKLACNRKSVLTFLNDHNEDIEEYLRITGNKVRTIEDLKLLVSYYNSLDEEY